MAKKFAFTEKEKCPHLGRYGDRNQILNGVLHAQR